MPVDFVAASDGTKLPTRTRTDGAPASGTVEVPEGVTDFLDGSGNPVPVSATAPMPITAGTGVTIPVSAASMPLPADAATQTTLAALNAKVTAVNTGAVTVSSSALPTGAATEATLANLNGKVTAVNTGAVVLAAGSAIAGRVGIDQTTPGTTNLVAPAGASGSVASLTNPVPTTMAALYYPSSTGNNTTAQLGAGATFTGTIESIVNQQAAQVTVICDQAYTVIIDQFQDAGGTRKTTVDAAYTFTRSAGVPLAENITLVGNFFRVRVTNNGGSTTTTLSVDVTFGIMPTHPYALSNLGNQKSSIAEINGTAIVTGGVAGSLGVGGLAASGAAVTGNPVLIGGSDGTNVRPLQTDSVGNLETCGKVTIVGPTSLSATGTLIAATDVGDLSHVTIQITGTFVATVTFEQSVDNTNWVNAFLTRSDTAAQVPSATTTAVSIFAGQLQGRFFRARVSAYTSGTVTGTADFGAAPVAPVTQQVQVAGGGGAATTTSPGADGNAAVTSLATIAVPFLHNNNNFDRQKNNFESTVYASAARTTAQTGTDQTNFNARGIRLTIDITAVAGAPSLTFTVQGKSTLANKYTNILVSTALTSVGTTTLQIYPGMLAAANLKADELLPRLWRVNVAVGTADSVTYSVDANYIL